MRFLADPTLWRTHSCVPRRHSWRRQMFCLRCSQECEHGTLRTCATTLVLAFTIVLQVGCGSIGQPLYPAVHIPSQVGDLTVVERGDNLDINFTIAPLTTEGLPLKKIGEVELRVGPNQSNGFNMNEWVKSATRVDVPTPANPGPVSAMIPVSKFVGSEVIVAVRVTNPKGKDAGWSPPKIFDVKAPLADPTNFRVAADPKGVALTWGAASPSQFRVLRKLLPEGKEDPQQKPALLATATEPNYIDISAVFGKTYQYSIQAVRENIESNVVGPETFTPADIFPPAVPSGLTASVGLGTVDLAWNRNTESTFKDYRVLRSEEGGPFIEVAKDLEGPVYSDHTAKSGKHYRYQIVAVGQNGRSSAPGEPVEIIAQ
jgi:hypothetical protein